jgi:chemosensory pili system protein ChpB (putative protein-glutamate methylesterase)
VGIVAAGDLRRHTLKKLVRAAGFDARIISPSQLPDELANSATHPDVWLLDTTDCEAPGGDSEDDLLDQIMQVSTAPLLLSDEAPPQASGQLIAWQRRLLGKLEELVAGAHTAPTLDTPQAVWILAASTGGPAAVGEFMAALRPGLPIALVYAQHIEANFDKVLGDALAQHRHFTVNLGRGAQQLLAGSVLVVPADRQLRFLPFHRVLETTAPWGGPYQPVCDQVIAQLARQYRGDCGVIVFSGLCDDGALGCRIAQSQGSAVWVQSPVSCACPEMPLAALATGVVSREGSPRELAEALNKRYSR